GSNPPCAHLAASRSRSSPNAAGHSNHWLHYSAGLRVLERTVDVAELVERDETVEREATGFVESDHLGDEAFRDAVTLDDPAHGSAEEHLVHLDPQLGVDRW